MSKITDQLDIMTNIDSTIKQCLRRKEDLKNSIHAEIIQEIAKLDWGRQRDFTILDYYEMSNNIAVQINNITDEQIKAMELLGTIYFSYATQWKEHQHYTKGIDITFDRLGYYITGPAVSVINFIYFQLEGSINFTNEYIAVDQYLDTLNKSRNDTSFRSPFPNGPTKYGL